MNPLLFKAHPLLQQTLEVLAGTQPLTTKIVLGLPATYLVLTLPLAALLAFRLRRALHIKAPFGAAYLLALPATLLFVPIALTLLGDIAAHAFRMEDRAIFLFALFVATILLAAMLGALVHYRNGASIGSEEGLILALTLLLACIPYGTLLLVLDRWLGLFPLA